LRRCGSLILTNYDGAIIKKVYNEMRRHNSESDDYNEALKDLELLIGRIKQ
jgi:hypothetical protein